MNRDISTPIYKTMTTDEIIQRLQLVKATNNILKILEFRTTYAGESVYTDKILSKLSAVNKLDGVIYDELISWLDQLKTIQELFQLHYADELEFLTKSYKI